MVGYDGYFRPDALITREEMAVVMVKLYELKQKPQEINILMLEDYNDKSKISVWAFGSIAKALQYGLLKGTSENTLTPVKTATRAEASVMLYRLYTAIF